MDYKKALLKGKEDPTDLLITATTFSEYVINIK